MKIDDLKNKILQLAIQGKLVPQDENDEPASVLLEKIREEKEQLIKEKKIKKEKPLPEISEEEKGFEIPEGWEWCRLNDICKVITDGTHHSPKSFDNGEYMYVTAKDIMNYGVETSNVTYVSKEVHEPIYSRCDVKKDDILITKDGKIGIVTVNQIDEPYSLLSSVGLIKINNSLLYNWYIVYAMRSPVVQSYIRKITKGSAIRRITITTISTIRFPLPPLSEQKRIVAKVDELFAFVDELGENKDAMAKCIADIRNKVLQLAIQGKLVKQDENDEPASVLLEKIRQEKQQLIKEKKIKKEKPLPEISDEEKAFDIPEGWEWCRVGEIATIKGGKRVPVGCKLQDESTEHIYIRVADMKFGTIVENDIKYISDDIFQQIKNYYIETHDIYITIAGTIGRVGTIPNKFNMANLTENAAKITCYQINKEFLCTIMKSFYIQTQIENKTKKVGQPKLALNQIQLLTIPLPPLSEQKRIVAKVDEIMNYLDNLERNLLL